MPKRLHRWYGAGCLHFITSSCFGRQPLLARPERRDLLLNILEQTRKRYRFVVVGYVVMPEHFHLLISEPERGNPSTVMQVLKQRFSRAVLSGRADGTEFLKESLDEKEHFWQRRFYDFVVWTERKRIEKLEYMHENPVRRGLVLEREHWKWSSFRWYAFRERGPVLIDEQLPAEFEALN